MSPLSFYRREYRRLILAEAPASLLDVGCGAGECIGKLVAAGVQAEGVEVEPTKVADLRAKGILAHVGCAEQLPFADGSFDLVVAEYCAHHFTDLPAALAEATRVARRGVFLIDPWYDLTIPSQRVGERWDRWFKAIDRAAGKVHHDMLAAERFRRALPPGSEWSFECRHLLALSEVDDAEFEGENAPYLEQVAGSPSDVAELATIRSLRARDGLSGAGAILVLLRRAGGLGPEARDAGR